MGLPLTLRAQQSSILLRKILGGAWDWRRGAIHVFIYIYRYIYMYILPFVLVVSYIRLASVRTISNVAYSITHTIIINMYISLSIHINICIYVYIHIYI